MHLSGEAIISVSDHLDTDDAYHRGHAVLGTSGPSNVVMAAGETIAWRSFWYRARLCDPCASLRRHRRRRLPPRRRCWPYAPAVLTLMEATTGGEVTNGGHRISDLNYGFNELRLSGGGDYQRERDHV